MHGIFSRLRILVFSRFRSHGHSESPRSPNSAIDWRREEIRRESQIDAYLDTFINNVPPHLRMALRTATSRMDESKLNQAGILSALESRTARIEMLLQEYKHEPQAEDSFRKEIQQIKALKPILSTSINKENEA